MSILNGVKDKFFENWANTFSCRPELYFEPETVDEIRAVLKMAQSNGKKIRAVGMGHSPSSLACTSDYMISLAKFNRLIHVKLFLNPKF